MPSAARRQSLDPHFSVLLKQPGDRLPAPVRVSVVDGQVVAETTGGFARLTGHRVHRIGLNELSDVIVDENGPLLTLASSDAQWELSGPECVALASTIRLLRTAPEVEQPPLVDTLIEVAVADGPWQSATATLTAERFTVTSGEASPPIVDVAWTEVHDPTLRGVRPTLSCRIGGESVRIYGAGARDLAAWLTTLAHRVGDGGTEASLERWSASRLQGPLAVVGELLISRHHLEFVPSGFVESAMGLRGVTISSRSLSRIVLHGWRQTALTLVHADGRVSFSVDDPEARFECLVQLVVAGMQEYCADAARCRQATEAVIDRWKSVFEDAHQPVLLAHPTVQLRDGHDAALGVIVLTPDHVRFLPVDGPTGATPAEQHAVAAVLRRYSSDSAAESELLFEVDGRSFRYLPAGGPAVIRRFWDRCRAPSRILRISGAPGRSLQRVLGPARFVRATLSGRVTVPVAELRDDGATWMLQLATRPEWGTGIDVAVEVGQPEGIYRFESRLVDEDLDRMRIHLQPPTRVRLYNQRRAYRVPVDLPARARLRTDSPNQTPLPIHDSLAGPVGPAVEPVGLPLKLSDLSVGGCAASGDARLPVGAAIDLELNLDEGYPVRVVGRVLRAEEAAEGALRRFGIRFEDVRAGAETRLQKHVLAAQRRELLHTPDTNRRRSREVKTADASESRGCAAG